MMAEPGSKRVFVEESEEKDQDVGNAKGADDDTVNYDIWIVGIGKCLMNVG